MVGEFVNWGIDLIHGPGTNTPLIASLNAAQFVPSVGELDYALSDIFNTSKKPITGGEVRPLFTAPGFSLGIK